MIGPAAPPSPPPVVAAPPGPIGAEGPVAVFRRPASGPLAGMVLRGETRAVAHANPAEAPGGGPAAGLRQDVGVLAWWEPIAGGPRWWGSLDHRYRGFSGGYRADATASAALVAMQPLWGPIAAHAGVAAIGLLGGPTALTAPRGLADLSAGLLAGWRAAPGLETVVGYQVDRVLDPGAPALTAHAVRLGATWRPGAGWVGAVEALTQWRATAGLLVPRQRLTASLDRAVGGGWEAGVLLQAVAAGSDGAAASDLAAGPRARWGY